MFFGFISVCSVFALLADESNNGGLKWMLKVPTRRFLVGVDNRLICSKCQLSMLDISKSNEQVAIKVLLSTFLYPRDEKSFDLNDFLTFFEHHPRNW